MSYTAKTTQQPKHAINHGCVRPVLDSSLGRSVRERLGARTYASCRLVSVRRMPRRHLCVCMGCPSVRSTCMQLQVHQRKPPFQRANSASHEPDVSDLSRFAAGAAGSREHQRARVPRTPARHRHTCPAAPDNAHKYTTTSREMERPTDTHRLLHARARSQTHDAAVAAPDAAS